MKFLVTGGAGKTGSQLVRALLDEGHEVVVFDNLSTGKSEALHKGVRFYLGDIRDLTLFSRILKDSKPDAIFHFAGLHSEENAPNDPLSFYETNVFGMHNILRAMISNSVKYLVYKTSPESRITEFGEIENVNQQMVTHAAQASGLVYGELQYSLDFEDREKVVQTSVSVMKQLLETQESTSLALESVV